MLFRSRTETKPALPKLDSATEKAQLRLEDLKAEGAKISSALDIAHAVARTTMAELDAPRAHLTPGAKARTVATLCDSLENIEAMYTWLLAKSKLNDDQIAEAKTALESAAANWRSGVLAQSAEEYNSAARTFKAALERFAAISASGGARRRITDVI